MQSRTNGVCGRTHGVRHWATRACMHGASVRDAVVVFTVVGRPATAARGVNSSRCRRASSCVTRVVRAQKRRRRGEDRIVLQRARASAAALARVGASTATSATLVKGVGLRLSSLCVRMRRGADAVGCSGSGEKRARVAAARAAAAARAGAGMRFVAARAGASDDAVEKKMTIVDVKCTASEQAVFDTLLEVVEHFKLNVTLRVAGGWVRDKLIGRESDDIDIALDTMLGKEFADKVNEYLTSQGVETKGIGVIQSNPEQSKHLETATMRVRDVWLDLVNLRSESYAEDSRIPEMEFGTAKDDAFRRDLTINALFYNINERKVEDFTESGVKDLERGVVRTPLPPRTTFLDDPLRILRAIRFAARFGFAVQDDIKHAASDVEVQEALRHKVSRERFGKEVLGMMKGRSPADAVSLMTAFKITPIVLFVPTQSVVDAITENADRLSTYLMRCAERAVDDIPSSSTWLDDENKVWLYLAAWLAPYRALESEGKKGKKVPAVGDMISNALKLRSKDAETAAHVHESMKIAKDVLLANADGFSRLDAGLALRKMGPTWRLACLLQSLVDQVPGMNDERIPEWGAAYAMDPTSVDADVARRVEGGIEAAVRTFETIERRVTEQALNECWDLKPPVTGQDVMAALNITKGGPQLKAWIDKSIEWVLENPCMTTEECVQRIKAES